MQRAEHGGRPHGERRRRERRPIPDAPRTASARAYLRGSLPGSYRFPDGNFTMRMVEAMEEVLDPVVAQLDLLPSTLDVTVATPATLRTISAWLGLPDEAMRPLEAQRAVLGNAAELRHRRGTPAGLALLLTLAFPADELEVADSGSTTWSRDPAPRGATWQRPTVTITSPHALSEAKQRSIRRVALTATPADVAVVVTVEEKS